MPWAPIRGTSARGNSPFSHCSPIPGKASDSKKARLARWTSRSSGLRSSASAKKSRPRDISRSRQRAPAQRQPQPQVEPQAERQAQPERKEEGDDRQVVLPEHADQLEQQAQQRGGHGGGGD